MRRGGVSAAHHRRARRRRHRLGHGARTRRRTARARTRPWGRSRTPCRPARAPPSRRRSCAAPRRGPSTRRARRSPSSWRTSASAPKRSPSTRSTGSSSRQLLDSDLASAARASSTPSSSTSESPVERALGPEEGEAHGAADEQRVGGLEEAVDQRHLVGHLRPAEHHDQRALRLLDDRPQGRDLALEEASGHRRAHQLGHPRRGGVRTMRGAEGVVHVRRPPARPGSRASSGSFFVLPGLPARVLEHEHLARAQGVGHLLAPRAHDLGRLPDRHVDQLRQPLPHRAQRGLGLAVLRAAQVRAEHQPGAAIQQQLDRRQRRPDPGVVGHAAALERDVEVHPHEHARARARCPGPGRCACRVRRRP